MSYWDYMWNGPAFAAGRFQRVNHPEDEVKADGKSTYKYKGHLTSQFFKDKFFIRVVDGTVILRSVPPEQRQEAIAKLNSMESASNVQGVVSGAGCIGSIVKAVTTAANGGVWGVAAAALGAVAVASFYRGYQASDEAAKWEDPIEKIKEWRRLGGMNFRLLEAKDWKGKVFTPDETAHVYHRTIKKLDRQFEIASSSGQVEQMDVFLNEFVRRTSPFLQHSLRYAYKDLDVRTRLQNPKKPEEQWEKDDLIKATDRFMAISQFFLNSKARFDADLQTIQQSKAAASVATQAAGTVASDVIRRNSEAAIAEQKRIRDSRLAAVRDRCHRGEIRYDQLSAEERRIKEAFENHPDVKKAQREHSSNQATVDNLTSLAQVGVGIVASMEEQRARTAAEQRIREELAKNTLDLFKFYRDQRRQESKGV